MPSGEQRISVLRLRRAVAQRAGASSVTAVAAEIGVSHRGLSLFLRGTRPQTRTVRKLEAWYRRSFRTDEDLEFSADQALIALLRTVPAHQRKTAIVRAIDCLEGVFTELDRPVPDELAALRERSE